jgi:hypothetical protein
MVLPGIQALFGFQLIAVFNSTFWDKLQPFEHKLHFLAIGFVILSIVLVMTPAAYHRQGERTSISERLVSISTRLLSWSMYPLMMGILIDCYLIGILILQSSVLSLLIAAFFFIVFAAFWIALPRLDFLQRWLSGSH